MKKWVVALVCVACVAVGASMAGEGQWTGFISDTHCRKAGADPRHTRESFEKCLRGGAKPILWTDQNEALLIAGIENLADLVGKHVRVTGTLDEPKRTIAAKKAEPTR